jgi:hypothetical protein
MARTSPRLTSADQQAISASLFSEIRAASGLTRSLGVSPIAAGSLRNWLNRRVA